MADNPTTPEPSAPALSAVQAEEIVRSLGLVFSNTYLYGPKHAVTRKAVDGSFSTLQKTLDICPEVSFNVAENELLVNGVQVETRNPLLRTFVTQLAGLDISSFSLQRGMSREKFEQLVEIMNRKPEEVKQSGGFPELVAQSGLEHVRARRVTYRQVAEDEVVMGKEVAEGATEAARESEQTVRTMIDYLKGGGSSEDAGTLQAVQQVSANADALAGAIVQAAEEEQEPSVPDTPDKFAEHVVGCLKRAYQGLMKDPALRTQKGKRNLARTLNTLEEKILSEMSEKFGGQQGQAAGAITDAIEEMSDELKVDALATEFMKKREAIDASEKRLLRYIKSKGVDPSNEAEVRERMLSSGLSPDAWQELLQKSGVGGAASTGGIAAAGHLASLLAQMESTFAQAGHGDQAAEQLNRMLAEVDKEVQKVVLKTEQKILDLVKNAQSEGGAVAAEGVSPDQDRITRKRLYEILSEIAQELCQPLSVVHCSLDMLGSGAMGEMTAGQKEMLSLALSSGERMQKLIDKLMEISGVPTTLHPDSKLQDSLYRPGAKAP